MEKRRQTVLVVDFGGSSTENMARLIREQRVYARIVPCTADISEIHAENPLALVLVGGKTAYHEGKPLTCDPAYLSMGIPVLAVGLGLRFMIEALGGEGRDREPCIPEKRMVRTSGTCAIFGRMPVEFEALIAGSDLVAKLPPGFRVAAKSQDVPHAAVVNEKARQFGLAFHPESEDTPPGRDLIRNFLYNICGADGDWDMDSCIEECIRRARADIGDGHVLLALSGGVDSTVVGVLLHRAIGGRLHCVFVDHGLLRKNECRDILDQYRSDFNLNVIGVDAADRFLSELAGVTDPEEKRKIIGRVFIEVFEEEAAKLTNVRFLAQGTIYPDVIESYSLHGRTLVKSHHNVGGLPEKLGLELVEPLRELFKDEVRKLGMALGVPADKIWRHPFPGPGLAVRIIGEVTAERVALLQEVDAIVLEE
ncbi:MAG: glutamine-hydrolyzing GMP synthase, partial [Planctomycetota bacterium]|nr:glutamine-hydrolyzing GMP synthase [Planctomycetota bacterium]